MTGLKKEPAHQTIWRGPAPLWGRMKWGKKSQSPVATIRVWALASHAMRDTKQSAATI